MLQEFPEVKEKLDTLFNRKAEEARMSHMGALTGGSRVFLEGNKTAIVREGGSVEEMEPKKTSVEFEVKPQEVAHLSRGMALDRINELAEKMAETQAKLVYDQIKASADNTGNAVSGEGEPSLIDLFLGVLEKISLDFDEEGNPTGLVIAVNPENHSSIEKVISEAETDPRYQAITERKKEEWRVRESARKLVG